MTKLAWILQTPRENLAAALKDLLEQVESLEDYTLTRDLPRRKAQACWDDAIHWAHRALDHAGKPGS